MLIDIYITITVLAWIFFGLALYCGSLLTKVQDLEANRPQTKKGLAIVFMLTSMLLFIFLAYTSFDVQTEQCTDNIKEVQTVTDFFTNQTKATETYTYYPTTCYQEQHIYDFLGGLYSFFVIISLIFLIYYSVVSE